MQELSLRNSHVFHAGGADFSRHFRSSVWAIASIAWSAISSIFATRKRAVFGAFGPSVGIFPESAFARFWGLLGPFTGISVRNRHGFRHRKSRFFPQSSGALARTCAPDASGRKSRWRCGTGEAGWPSPRQGLLSLRLNWTKVKVVLRDKIFAVQHPPRSTSSATTTMTGTMAFPMKKPHPSPIPSMKLIVRSSPCC